MSNLILVTGGARSGKSRWAVEFLRAEHSKAFVATAVVSDDEMAERIACHRRERAESFDTYEEPVALADVMTRVAGRYAWILIDCVTLWVNNLLLAHAGAEERARDEIQRFLSAVAAAPAEGIVVVTNEVGMGIVPDNALARRYRDWVGWVNQELAARAHEVVWLVSGVPLWVKGKGRPNEEEITWPATLR